MNWKELSKTIFKIDGNIITGKKSIANNINNFFVNIGSKLEREINVPCYKNFSHFLSDKRDENFNFTAVDENNFRKIADKLDNKKSCGIDGISNIIMKSIINILFKPITIIINQMLETGDSQSNLKLRKLFLYLKKEIPPYRLIIDLFLFSNLFQRYLKKLYTNNCMLILKTQTCFLKVNMASVKAIPLKWHL